MKSGYDYNVKGADYQSFAFSHQDGLMAVLSSNAQSILTAYQKYLWEKLKNATAQERESFSILFAAFEQLGGFLLQVRRIGESAQKLPSAHKAEMEKCKTIMASKDWEEFMRNSGPPAMIVIPSEEIYFDFENLLFKATSVLDVLAKFVALETLQQRGNVYFSDLQSKIYATEPIDLRADYLWADLESAKPMTDTVLSGSGPFKGLRNLLMHNTSVPQLTRCNFVLHWLEETRILIFDHEIEVAPSTGESQPKVFPVLHTTQKLCQVVTWILYRTAYQYSCRLRNGAICHNPGSWPGGCLGDFRPNWGTSDQRLRERGCAGTRVVRGL